MCAGKRGKLVVFAIVYTKTALKDIPKLKAAHLDGKAKDLIAVVRDNPYQTPPVKISSSVLGSAAGNFSTLIDLIVIYWFLSPTNAIRVVNLWMLY